VKIRAAVLHRTNSPFAIEQVDLDPPAVDEVLVRMRAAGICHSDWHLATGATSHPLPVVPGHEGAGVIEAVGDGVRGLAVGDHVALNWAPSCRRCYYCRMNRPALCEAFLEPIWAGHMMDDTARLALEGRRIHHFNALSCFAEYAVVPVSCCVRLAKDVPFEVAALIGCAVTTGVGAVTHTVELPRAASVAVFGAGGVGLSIIMAAKMRGANPLIAIDRTAAKGELARSFGATHALLSGEDVPERIRELAEGRGVDVAFDATGVVKIQRQCVEAIRPVGRVVLVGLSGGEKTLEIAPAKLVRQEKSILGSYYGSADPATAFPQIASHFQRGQLPLDRLISRRYSLDEINEAYQTMLAGETARGVIVFE